MIIWSNIDERCNLHNTEMWESQLYYIYYIGFSKYYQRKTWLKIKCTLDPTFSQLYYIFYWSLLNENLIEDKKSTWDSTFLIIWQIWAYWIYIIAFYTYIYVCHTMFIFVRMFDQYKIITFMVLWKSKSTQNIKHDLLRIYPH